MRGMLRCRCCKRLYPLKHSSGYCNSQDCIGLLEKVEVVVFWAKKDTPKSKKPLNDWEKRKRRKAKNTEAYKLWRIAVFTRDKLTCQHYGQEGGELSAHHIRPWAGYPKLRYVVSNGLTLCVSCHEKLHSSQQLKLL